MAALGLQKLLGIDARRRRPAGRSARRPDPLGRQPAGLVAERRRRLELDRHGRRQRALRHVAGRLGAEPGAEGRLQRARRRSSKRPSACVQNQIAAAADNDYESKAILLHALSTAGQGDFALANRLYRERPQLSTGGAGASGAGLGRNGPQADGRRVARPAGQAQPRRRCRRAARPRSGSLPWSQSPAELRALWALALQQVAPAVAEGQGSWSIGSWPIASGHRWSPDKATGPATLALCRWFAESRFEGEHYTLTVFVNDVLAKTLDVDPDGRHADDRRARQLLKKDDKQRINFQIAGRGRYTYQCILGGFVPADKLKSTTDDWTIERTYEPAPLELDGREVPRGFGVLQGSYRRVQQSADATARRPAGTGRAATSGGRTCRPIRPRSNWNTWSSPSRSPAARRSSRSRSAAGSSGSRSRPARSRSTSAIAATSARSSTNSTAICRAATARRRRWSATPIGPSNWPSPTPKSLAVLPLGAKSADPYRLTPQELFELGKRCFDKGDLKTAGEHLTELVEELEPHARRLQAGGADALGRPPGARPAGRGGPLLRDRQGEVAATRKSRSTRS